MSLPMFESASVCENIVIWSNVAASASDEDFFFFSHFVTLLLNDEKGIFNPSNPTPVTTLEMPSHLKAILVNFFDNNYNNRECDYAQI